LSNAIPPSSYGESSRREAPPNRDWIWFFVVLSGLGAAAVTIPIVYNLYQQLTADELTQARQRWLTSGPRDYVLDYQQKYTHDGATDETVYRVVVRNRQVAAVACDGRLTLLAGLAPALALGPWPRALPEASDARDIDGMFGHMEGQLARDRSLPKRPYATATFDSRDGHPTRYVRRLPGGAERLEWTVKVTSTDK
jgi:hypothetical protein